MAVDTLGLPIVAVASSSWLSRILLIWEFTQFEAGAILPADSDLKEDVTMPVDSELFEASAGKHMVSPGMIPLNHPSAAMTRRKSENVLRLKADGRSTDDIATEAGVSRATVIRILRYVERAVAG